MVSINNILMQAVTSVMKDNVILAFDDVLDIDEFKKAIEDNEIINEWKSNCWKITYCLTIAQKFIQSNQISSAYRIWETILNPLLLQNNNYQRVSLLILGGLESNSLDLKYVSKEYDTLTKRGVLQSGTSTEQDAISSLFKKSILSAWIQGHLDQMLWDIYSSEIKASKSHKDLQIYFNNYNINKAESFRTYVSKKGRYNMYKRLCLSKTQKSFTAKEFMYGDNPQWKGQAADAFLQHLAHMHIGMFKESKSNFMNITDIEQQSSVFKEEQSNMFELLLQSRNNTPWYTGGDLILKLSSGQILNIQLKTQLSNLSRQKAQLNSNITTNKLEDFFTKMLSYFKDIDKNKDELIKLLFNELKTSAWVEQKVNPALTSEITKKLAQ